MEHVVLRSTHFKEEKLDLSPKKQYTYYIWIYLRGQKSPKLIDHINLDWIVYWIILLQERWHWVFRIFWRGVVLRWDDMKIVIDDVFRRWYENCDDDVLGRWYENYDDEDVFFSCLRVEETVAERDKNKGTLLCWRFCFFSLFLKHSGKLVASQFWSFAVFVTPQSHIWKIWTSPWIIL